MPTKKVRIGVGVVLVLLAMLLAPILDKPDAMQTSYSKTPTGHRALFDLLHEFRPEFRRWRSTPKSLERWSAEPDSQRALLMVEPMPELLQEGEAYLDALVDWVRAGNDLVLVPRIHDAAVAEAIGREFEFHTEPRAFGEGIEALLDAAGLTGKLGSRGMPETKTPDLAFRTHRGDELKLPFLLQLHGIDSDFEPTWGAFGEDNEEQELVVEAPLGKGRIAVVLAPGLFWNRSIGEGDNGFVLLEILAEYGRDGLLLDEYYHGLPAIGGFKGLLLTPPFLWVTLSFLVLAALVTWRSLVRAEPLLDHPLPLRRSKREHIDAMGRLIARSGQNDWVVERVLDGLQLEVRECLRLDLNTPMDTVLDFLRRTDEVLAERLESLIATAPLNSRGRASQAAAVEWGRKSHAFLRDLYASRKAGAHS